MNEKLSALYNAILEGSVPGARDGVQTALDAGHEPGSILTEGMIAAMKEVGRLFEEGEIFVPDMLIAARAMQAGLSLLKPHLVSSNPILAYSSAACARLRNLYPYTRYVPRNVYLCSTLNRLFSSPGDAIHNTSSSYKISYL